MKIIHVPFCFYPQPVGGTEVYVDGLSRQQQREGMTPVVAAPGPCEDRYSHRGIAVRSFPVTERVADIRELYGEGDELAATAFANMLDDETPDVVHLHAFTRGSSLRIVREARRRRIPVVFSYHTPTVSCQRGTLLRWGSELCDGVLDVRTCSQCSLHGLSLGRTLSTVAGWIPSGVGRAVGTLRVSGGAWTVLRTTELVALRHATFRSFVSEVDQVVALCHWVRDVLVRNGVPDAKITVSRQGFGSAHDPAPKPIRKRETGDPLRVMFAGRLNPTKGVHTLIRALRASPDLRIELDIYGIAQGDADAAYLRELKDVSGSDARITFRDPIPAEDMVPRMREYDVVAVPSQCLETGPMVVMEAFAARLPVIGSNLGGIAELVTHDVNGLLLEPPSAEAWRAALERLYSDPALLSRLRSEIPAPRSMSDVAADMRQVYDRVFEKTGWGPRAKGDCPPDLDRSLQSLGV